MNRLELEEISIQPTLSTGHGRARSHVAPIHHAGETRDEKAPSWSKTVAAVVL